MSQLTDSSIRELHGWPGTALPITVTGTSAATATALVAGTMYRIATTVAVHMAHGASPTATANDEIVPAGIIFLRASAAEKIAMIKVSGQPDGLATVTPLTGWRV